MPFLHYQLALLSRHGVRDVVLACSYLVERVEAALGDGREFGVRLRYAVEPEPLGTGGGVRHATDLRAGTLVVLNGDVLTDLDLGAMARFHEARRARASLFLTPVEDPTAYGLVETDARGRVRRFVEKPRPEEATTNTINAGVYLLDAALLELIPAGRAVSIEREFFPGLLAREIPFFGFVAPAYWRDIGSLEAYRQAQADLLRGRVDTPLGPPGTRRGDVWMGEAVAVAPGATVTGPTVLGSEVRLEPGARVGPLSVLGDGVTLGRESSVEGAILWDRVRVGEAARLRQCVVGSGAVIGSGTEVGPGGVVAENAVVP